MTSYYSIVQVTMDPVADERINLGVVAFDDEGSGSVFTTDLRRTAGFLGSNFETSNVEQMIFDVQDDLSQALACESALEQIRDISNRWQHTIRLTSPRSSTLNWEHLLSNVSTRALPSRPASSRARDRRAAVSLARQSLRAALEQAESAIQVKNNVSVRGQRQEHFVELGLVNGAVRRGVTGLSLESEPTPNRDRELSALKWLVDDIKAQDGKFPISVVVLAEDRDRGQDLDILRALGAELVTEPELEDWAERAVAATR